MLTDDGKHLYVSWDEYHLLIERLALKIDASGWASGPQRVSSPAASFEAAPSATSFSTSGADASASLGSVTSTAMPPALTTAPGCGAGAGRTRWR